MNGLDGLKGIRAVKSDAEMIILTIFLGDATGPSCVTDSSDGIVA
jgi:hypothetical protein